MQGRCCCGCCLLYTGTGIALAFAEIEAICYIIINIELLLLISQNQLFNPTALIINIEKIDDFEIFHGIVLAAVGLHAFWFAFGIFAATGNITQSHGRLTPWVFLTYLISIFQFGVSVYFCIKFQSSFADSPHFYVNSVPTKTLTYLSLMCIYTGAGLILLINFYIAHVVEKRGKEIDQDYSALTLYILSHMSRCSHLNGDTEQNLISEGPPSYASSCPLYLPSAIDQRTNDSSGSSWSLSCEALKTLNTGQLGTTSASNENNERRNILGNMVGLMGSNPSCYQHLNTEIDHYAVLP